MTRVTEPDCAVMFNLINTHAHICIYIYWVWLRRKNTHTNTHTQRHVQKLCGFCFFPYITYALCMVTHIAKSMDQPGKVVNSARAQLNRENEYFPVRVRA